jgi:hypothetical protein
MYAKAAKAAVIVLGMLGASMAMADDGRSFDSYSHDHHRGGLHVGEGGNGNHFHVASVPEPSEWIFLGLGLVLIGAVAHRRQSKLLGK